MGSLVFAHQDLDEQDERLREHLLEGLGDTETLEALLREKARGFSETVNKAVENLTIHPKTTGHASSYSA